jgi:anti-sigma factor RsiW
MNSHPYYEELAALAAGGNLSDEQQNDLQRHLEICAQCRTCAADFNELVHAGLPLVQGSLGQLINMLTIRRDPGAKDRFIRRAALAAVAFSHAVTG